MRRDFGGGEVESPRSAQRKNFSDARRQRGLVNEVKRLRGLVTFGSTAAVGLAIVC
jgi:hypothetical protein